MASDRIRYGRALEVWQGHIDRGDLSLPSEIGSVAILLPYLRSKEEGRDESEQLPALRKEACSLADKLRLQGRESVVAINAEPEDFKRVLTDPVISAVILIGHGCLSSVEVENIGGGDRLDWEDLARMADHLKMRFVQRVCGTLPRPLNVPLGLMVVSDHRQVHALVGRRFAGDDLARYDGAELAPVTALAKMWYEDIQNEFPQRKLSTVSRAHVALGAFRRGITHKDKD